MGAKGLQDLQDLQLWQLVKLENCESLGSLGSLRKLRKLVRPLVLLAELDKRAEFLALRMSTQLKKLRKFAKPSNLENPRDLAALGVQGFPITASVWRTRITRRARGRTTLAKLPRRRRPQNSYTLLRTW